MELILPRSCDFATHIKPNPRLCILTSWKHNTINLYTNMALRLIYKSGVYSGHVFHVKWVVSKICVGIPVYRYRHIQTLYTLYMYSKHIRKYTIGISVYRYTSIDTSKHHICRVYIRWYTVGISVYRYIVYKYRYSYHHICIEYTYRTISIYENIP